MSAFETKLNGSLDGLPRWWAALRGRFAAA
jgi:hypothetical protein